MPADWGIYTDAAYAAVTYAYQFYSTPLNASWVEARAWPFLSGVAAFWECRLVKTPVPGAPGGYEYWDPDDCTGDEGCSVPAAERGNPMWAAAFVRRLFATLLDMAAATGRTPPPAWSDVLAHLPPVPVAWYAPKGAPEPVPVLAWYGTSNYTNMGGQVRARRPRVCAEAPPRP